MTAPQNPRVTQEREWTRWSDQRPPNARGVYRYRASFDLLGLPVTAEWEEEMHLCGMGYSDSEWWPLSPCYWNGYRRYITNDTLEWSSVRSYDQPGVLWQGLDLLPCPFTGKAPTVSAQGKYIGAPLWQSEAVWIGSPAVPKRRFTNAKAMVAAWNTRHREAAEAASKAREAALAEALRGLVASVDDLISESGGVYGLHLNGDPSPWSELTEGGRFEEWLIALEAARATLAETQPERTQP